MGSPCQVKSTEGIWPSLGIRIAKNRRGEAVAIFQERDGGDDGQSSHFPPSVVLAQCRSKNNEGVGVNQSKFFVMSQHRGNQHRGRPNILSCTVQIATKQRTGHSEPPGYGKECPTAQTTLQADKALTPALPETPAPSPTKPTEAARLDVPLPRNLSIGVAVGFQLSPDDCYPRVKCLGSQWGVLIWGNSLCSNRLR